jgi:transposase
VGFIVLLLYRMRRVDCRDCGVEEAAVGDRQAPADQGPHAVFGPLGEETIVEGDAQSFRSSWDKVCQAVEYVVGWGLEHRTLGPILAIGVDEIQYADGHKHLTLVYQIEKECTRLLWIGKERTVESFEQFFTVIGQPTAEKIAFVCSGMWPAYLRVIRERSGASSFVSASTSGTLLSKVTISSVTA